LATIRTNGRTAKRETLIPLVTNSRRSLRNGAMRRWRVLARVSSNTNCTAPMNFLWSFRVLRQQTATRGNDFARWTVDGRLIDRFLRQTALLCAPFYSAYIAHGNAISRIELKLKKVGLNQNRTRLVSMSSWRYRNNWYLQNLGRGVR